MQQEGWYTRITTNQTPEIRWLSVTNFWINIYTNKKDKAPVLSLHTSKLEFDSNVEDTGHSHAFRIIIIVLSYYHVSNNIFPNHFTLRNIPVQFPNFVFHFQKCENNIDSPKLWPQREGRKTGVSSSFRISRYSARLGFINLLNNKGDSCQIWKKNMVHKSFLNVL